jgi:hypothetical protein
MTSDNEAAGKPATISAREFVNGDIVELVTDITYQDGVLLPIGAHGYVTETDNTMAHVLFPLYGKRWILIDNLKFISHRFERYSGGQPPPAESAELWRDLTLDERNALVTIYNGAQPRTNVDRLIESGWIITYNSQYYLTKVGTVLLSEAVKDAIQPASPQPATEAAGSEADVDTEYISIWGLLKSYVKECELANNEHYRDSAWQRIKRLETDLNKAMSNNLNYEINLQTSGAASNPSQLSQLVDKQQTELTALHDQLEVMQTDWQDVQRRVQDAKDQLRWREAELTALRDQNAALRALCGRAADTIDMLFSLSPDKPEIAADLRQAAKEGEGS